MARRKPRILPLTPARWPDLVELFGPRGACGGCWCMTPRLSHRDYEAGKGEGNKRALKRLVRRGVVPGLLAYVDGQPAGWCALGPRRDYVRLATSRILKPVDARPTWSLVCFYVRKEHRGQGVSKALIEGAVRHAREHGARLLEGYPVEPRKKDVPPVFAYTGLLSAFESAGFREVARRSPTRPIMRRTLRPRRKAADEGEGEAR